MKKNNPLGCKCKNCINHICHSAISNFVIPQNPPLPEDCIYIDPVLDDGKREPAGSQGVRGHVAQLGGRFETLDELQQHTPFHTPGNFYFVGTEIYYWHPGKKNWTSAGSMAGPTGPAGSHGGNCEDYTPGYLGSGFPEESKTTGIQKTGAVFFGEEVKRVSGHLSVPYTNSYVAGEYKILMDASPLPAQLLVNQGGSIKAPRANNVPLSSTVNPISMNIGGQGYNNVVIDDDGQLAFIYTIGSLTHFPGTIDIYYWVDFI